MARLARIEITAVIDLEDGTSIHRSTTCHYSEGADTYARIDNQVRSWMERAAQIERECRKSKPTRTFKLPPKVQT